MYFCASTTCDKCIIESMKGFGIGLLVGVLLVLLVPFYDWAEGWLKWR